MTVNDHIHHFTIRSVTELEELGGRLYEMEHQTSGARLVWLDRDCDNKTFGICFRTTPGDDTGVFHILEHSVLCGSERYPVKEPFVELMKSSMNTFLNAITFPDKTFYPVSSRNRQDFLNLIRVYMDAVLHPLLYRRPEIFRQEGWHYEVREGAVPCYKGVVFNEMKGAMASPDTLMQAELNRRLFPDTCYRFVSGGDPAHIPELTYEGFCESHRRFYHPSNAYIFLDGGMDVGEVLSLLDGTYLGAYRRQACATEIPAQRPVDGGEGRIFYEVSSSEPTAGKARFAWGFGLGDYACREERAAFQVLGDVLCGSNQAPLKRRILSAGLGEDVSMWVMDGIRQPYGVLSVRNLEEGRTEELKALVRETLTKLADTGLDREQVRASLANLAFHMRERDFGYFPQGLGLGLQVLESWLYGGHPAEELTVGPLLETLGRRVDQGWFEELLRRVMLDNPHTCRAALLPSHTVGEEQRRREREALARAQAGWDQERRAALLEQQRRLDDWQSAPDRPEDLAALPRLRLSDIPEEPETVPTEETALAGVTVLRHILPTGGIGYWNLYFDLGDLTGPELSVASFLCALLGRLDAGPWDALALQKQIRRHLGDVSFTVEAYGDRERPDRCRTCLCASFSALAEEEKEAAGVVAAILTATDFSQAGPIRERLLQARTAAEQGVLANGHAVAMTRVTAAFTAEGAAQEHAGGYTYCRQLKDWEKEDDPGRLGEAMAALCRRIFVRGRLTASVTGQAGMTCLARVIESLPDGPAGASGGVAPWGIRREGLVIPADVSFAALGGPLAGRCTGGMRVAGRVASLAYLWNAVRVQGGAYGVGLLTRDSGSVAFYSFRDPNGARSLDCYRQTAGFLRRFAGEKPDLTGFIIGAVGELEPALLPRRQGRMADGWYFRGETAASRRRFRRELLAASERDLRQLAEVLDRAAAEGAVFVAGPRAQVEECKVDDLYIL